MVYVRVGVQKVDPKMPRGRKTVTPGHEKVNPGHKKVPRGHKKVPRGGRFDSQCTVQSYRIHEMGIFLDNTD
jgi:hypothetical protein